MPKNKSKSGAKKRFGLTGSGHVKRKFAYKNHNLRQKTQKMKRQHRGMRVMSKPNERHAKAYYGVHLSDR